MGGCNVRKDVGSKLWVGSQTSYQSFGPSHSNDAEKAVKHISNNARWILAMESVFSLHRSPRIWNERLSLPGTPTTERTVFAAKKTCQNCRTQCGRRLKNEYGALMPNLDGTDVELELWRQFNDTTGSSSDILWGFKELCGFFPKFTLCTESPPNYASVHGLCRAVFQRIEMPEDIFTQHDDRLQAYWTCPYEHSSWN